MRSPLLAPALLAGLAGLAGCLDASTRSTDQPVIGGEQTPDGQYPAVGALYVADFGGASCTGTLIRPDVVLTAAHCVEPEFLGGAVPGFTLDNDTINGTPTVVPGLRYVQHDSFDINVEMQPGLQQFFDVGLLWLAEPITTTSPMTMATPAEAQAGLVAGLDVEIVGYGRTSNDTFDYGIKFHAVTDLVAWNDSELQLGDGVTPQNCNGDSGGPAIVDWGSGPRLAGIVSRSATLDGDCLHGGIDTRVDYYLAWIEAQLEAACEGGCPDAGAPDAAPDVDAATGPDAGDPGAEGEDAGCCSTGGGDTGAGSLLLGSLVLGLALRRRHGGEGFHRSSARALSRPR